jgi:hypothetical protein
VVEAAHTYLPEAGIEALPELAREEMAAGLGGPTRSLIGQTAPDEPALLRLRDDLLVGLGTTADVTGALTLLDRVYTGRLLRGQVPPIVTASCLTGYSHWRHTNNGHSLSAAHDLAQLVEEWIARPEGRHTVEAKILAYAEQLAVHTNRPLEDQAV